jgi:hypothetical protein
VPPKKAGETPRGCFFSGDTLATALHDCHAPPYGAAVFTFAAPGVGVVVNDQSVAALFVSVPSGMRASVPSTVFESATSTASTVPSTRSNTLASIVAVWIAPS